MYNEQLEQLIDAALADGELTEKEKQILFKKAQALGVDLDEFEMVLDARLFKLQKAQQPQTAISSAPKSDKYGDVKKCPACGAMIEAFTTRCTECGHEFSNIAANSSIQKLFEMLNSVDRIEIEKDRPKTSLSGFLSAITDNSNSFNQKKTIIQNFPIPNTKEDIIEFLTLAVPLAKTKKSGILRSFLDPSRAFDEYDPMRPIWKNKCEQIIMKAKFSMQGDKQALEMIKEYANELKIKM